MTEAMMFGDTTNLKIDETAKWSGYIFLYNIRKLFIYVGVGKIKLIAISQLVLFCCHNDKPALDKCRVNIKEPQRRIIRFDFFYTSLMRRTKNDSRLKSCWYEEIVWWSLIYLNWIFFGTHFPAWKISVVGDWFLKAI